MDISNALSSYLQSRDQQARGKIDPPTLNLNKNDFNETTLIIPSSQVDRWSRDMKISYLSIVLVFLSWLL